MFKFLLLIALFGSIVTLPWLQQIALANSLEVGRPTDPENWDCADCYDSNRPISTRKIKDDVKDIHSIVSVYSNVTILAFRYTASALNVWQDILWTFQVQDEYTCKGCKVQRQYHRMWQKIKQDVIDEVVKSGNKKLVITGISLGGALACISYVDLRLLSVFGSVEVITYGAPRVGNAKWAAWFDATTPSKRIFIFEDPVAILPRCLSPHCNYRQTGTAIVCHPTTNHCEVRDGEYVEDYTLLDSSRHIVEQALSYDQNSEVDGVMAHIFGYKKIYNYTQDYDN